MVCGVVAVAHGRTRLVGARAEQHGAGRGGVGRVGRLGQAKEVRAETEWAGQVAQCARVAWSGGAARQ